ncbi:MAG: glutamine--fructose-6-phosphate transaminase (isomerizing) [Alphaproteobacteria bacterium]|nr:glutamine--fructose-6-phosphate transaminase (isomerizing) [Alphaproteobacteria bacterium]
MCGIVGYIGEGQAADIILDALKRLEYRGYDSSGIATLEQNALHLTRAVGKLSHLEAALQSKPQAGQIGIGHTRWATHGGVTEANAHPHVAGNKVAIVHNGIIENYAELKTELQAKGHEFSSQTDSEVLAHLFLDALGQGQTGSAAMQAVLAKIKGAFALAVMLQEAPDQLFVARNASPLAIGIEDGLICVASDAMAMAHLTRNVIYLKDGDYAALGVDDVQIYDRDGQRANREVIRTTASPALIDKGGFRHFMEKEIHEQPEAIAHTISAMTAADGALRTGLSEADLSDIQHLVILAAGTSNYAGQIGRYWLEDIAGIPVSVETASEYRYRAPAHLAGGAVIAISQSGESLDTLMALRHAREKGMKVIAIVNVPESSIAREADVILPTRAGPEIGVASTKAFTAQLTVLFALAVDFGRAKARLSAEDVAELQQKLLAVPGAVGAAIASFEQVQPVAQHLKKTPSCLFLGRGRLYPLALEAALKLKELSYIHAEGFAAGEMKHGPIALIEDELPVICLLDEDTLSAKTISNLKEAEARGATIILIATQTIAKQVDFASFKVVIEDCDPLLAPIILAVPAQILAYQTAFEKGTDVDQPRNLAKSVTVE